MWDWAVSAMFTAGFVFLAEIVRETGGSARVLESREIPGIVADVRHFNVEGLGQGSEDVLCRGTGDVLLLGIGGALQTGALVPDLATDVGVHVQGRDGTLAPETKSFPILPDVAEADRETVQDGGVDREKGGGGVAHLSGVGDPVTGCISYRLLNTTNIDFKFSLSPIL